MKQKNKKTFYNWLTNRYQLIIRNEENFAEKTTFGFNYARVIVVGFFFFLFVFIASLYFGKYALSSWYSPEYETNKQREEIAELAAYVDSLSMELERRDQYNMLFDAMLLGGEGIEDLVDTATNFQDVDISKLFGLDTIPYMEEQIRAEYEERVVGAGTDESNYHDYHFFSPFNGAKVTEKFSVQKGILQAKLEADQNVPVTCITDGTVLLTGRSAELGNFIMVQHADNIVSIYGQNEEILKNVGNFVKAGDIIAGAQKSTDQKSSITFGLWINGNPVDPLIYITKL